MTQRLQLPPRGIQEEEEEEKEEEEEEEEDWLGKVRLDVFVIRLL